MGSQEEGDVFFELLVEVPGDAGTFRTGRD
jgi:hypothetical protein